MELPWCYVGDQFSDDSDGHPLTSRIPDNYHNTACIVGPGTYYIVISRYCQDCSSECGQGGFVDLNFEAVIV